MRIVHALERYLPDASGGTEVYVSGLARELVKLGVDSTIAAAWDASQVTTYSFDGIEVFRYPGRGTPHLRQIRGELPHDGFSAFAEWLVSRQLDIFHQHSWTLGCGLHHLRHAKQLGLATVLTVHVPANICLRGTMMLNGQNACTAKASVRTCAPCWSAFRGAGPIVGGAVSRVPLALSRIAKGAAFSSRTLTALATPALVEAHCNSIAEMIRLSDRIVAVCRWVYEALLVNGVPAEKLVLSRQGTAEPKHRKARERTAAAPLRVGFIGRWSPTKGVGVLVEAVRRMPADAAIELHVHAMPGAAPEELYRREVVALAEGDPRIIFGPPLPREDVADVLQTFDVLAVPSQWLETGPLVVLEAQSVGTPVVGSRLGGIAELIRDGIDGVLVPHHDVSAWTDALLTLIRNHSLVATLQRNVPSARTMHDVAIDMAALYRELHTLHRAAEAAPLAAD